MESSLLDPSPKLAIPSRANGRFTSPTALNGASQRRSFLPRPGSRDGPAASPDNTISPNNSNTKIPRLSQQRTSQENRRFSTFDAWKIAEEEELNAAQGSPSPAPRLFRSRRDSRAKASPKSGAETPSDVQQRRRLLTASSDTALDDRAGSLRSSPNHSLRSQVSDGSFDEKLRRHAADQGEQIADSPKRNSGSFSNRIAELGKDLVRKTSRGSLDGSSPSQNPKARSGARWLSRRFSSRKTEPSNSMTEHGPEDGAEGGKVSDPALFRSGRVTPPTEPDDMRHDRQTPLNKSFAWEADADFTAGDLQASDSPPVALGRTNTRIDEIKALEAQADQMFPDSPKLRSHNTRIDEIRAAEQEAAEKFPDEPLRSQAASEASQDAMAGNEDRPLRTVQTRRPSAKSDAIVTREIESLSRKALTTTRLDEIRVRDADDRSRSASPELVRPSSRELLRSISSVNGGVRKQSEGAPVSVFGRERTPSDTFGAVPPAARSSSDDVAPPQQTGGKSSQEPVDGGALSRGSSRTRDESRDILRRLARATGTTPSPEQRTGKGEVGIPTTDVEGRDTARQRRSDGVKSEVRLSVGFVGLPRNPSLDSISDRRSNFSHSDSDPIERIEGEMQLFAPLDNQSERGSLRAPSPESDDDGLNDTPRAPKPDPMMLPTPRVTGAFLDTPAIIRSEKLEVGPLLDPAGAEPKATTSATASTSTAITATSDEGLSFRGRKPNGSAPRSRPSSTVSAKAKRQASRSASASAHRRTRSLPRQRSSLINSARPPTVKDDLLEIQRANHVEDSTLDDFADLLDAHERDHGLKVEEGSDDDLLGTFDRMNKSLQTGLLGIQTAKRGIERLENEVSHVDSKRLSHNHDLNVSLVCPVCQGHATEGKGTLTYLHLPVPRLWDRRKGFKFTWFGLMLFLLSLWYIAESTMCFYFCKPQYCYPGKPCDWSMDDPHWGYAIPVKLDQWSSGGKGRAFVDRLRPEVSDWIADMLDVATGTDITRVDTSHYNWEQKRQHRRRLAKKGLVASSAESPEDAAKFAAWRAARLAKERAESAKEMGYDVNDDEESMDADERI
ncbi:hypothetical protein V8F06_013170 [Rhypophila decipiens]